MEPDEQKELEEAIEGIAIGKRLIKTTSESVSMLEQTAVEIMEANQIKKHMAKDHTATMVQGSRLVPDVPKLMRTLTKAQWDSITKRVLDQKLLEDAIAKGKINPMVIAKCYEDVPNKPYIKIGEARKADGMATQKPKSLREAVAKRPGPQKVQGPRKQTRG